MASSNQRNFRFPPAVRSEFERLLKEYTPPGKKPKPGELMAAAFLGYLEMGKTEQVRLLIKARTLDLLSFVEVNKVDEVDEKKIAASEADALVEGFQDEKPGRRAKPQKNKGG